MRTSMGGLASLLLLGILLSPPSSSGSPPSSPRAAPGKEHRDAWKRMGPAIEVIARSAGAAGGPKVAEAAALLVDLHAAYAEEVLGSPVGKERRALAASAIVAAATAAREPAQVAALRTAARNRALFVEILGGMGDRAVVESLLDCRRRRAARRGAVEPTPPGEDLVVAAHQGAVTLDPGSVRVLLDAGLAGSGNGVVDAGETATLQVPLAVGAGGGVSVSRGVLQSVDPMVRIDNPEVSYVTRDFTGKPPAGAPAGTVLRPREGFTFTVLPSCPDGREVPFELEFVEEAGRRSVLSFTLRIRSVGPVLREERTVEDGKGLRIKGNGNGVFEPGEAVVLATPFRLRGAVPVASVEVVLESRDPLLEIGAGGTFRPALPDLPPEEILLHRCAVSMPPAAGASLSRLRCEWTLSGTVKGRPYAWSFPELVGLGMGDAEWAETLGVLRGHAEDGYPAAIVDFLRRPLLAYRLEGEAGEEARRLLAAAVAELGPEEGDIAVGGGAGGVFGQRRSPERARKLEGGEGTEAAVAAGLEWLAAHQSKEGFWSAEGFGRDCGDRPCGGPGSPSFDTGVTGLALMAFLAAGETHRTPKYGPVVKRGLDFLLASQGEDGCLGPKASSHFVYNHAIATWALCEVYGMTRSRLFRDPARRAVAFVLACRNPGAGWRYGVRPGNNDTSVTTWMTAALAAAEWAEIPVDPAAREGTMKWLDGVTEREWGRVGYSATGNGPARPEDLMDAFPADKSEADTAMGLFDRFLCGEGNRDPLVQKAADLCLKTLPAWSVEGGSIDYIYWHFGSLGMFQTGGPHWKAWSAAVKKALVPHQVADRKDHRYGSWDPVDPWGRDGGRVYATAINVLTLETFHRYARLR